MIKFALKEEEEEYCFLLPDDDDDDEEKEGALPILTAFNVKVLRNKLAPLLFVRCVYECFERIDAWMLKLNRDIFVSVLSTEYLVKIAYTTTYVRIGYQQRQR